MHRLMHVKNPYFGKERGARARKMTKTTDARRVSGAHKKFRRAIEPNRLFIRKLSYACSCAIDAARGMFLSLAPRWLEIVIFGQNDEND